MQSRLPSLRGIEAFVNAAETLSFRTAAERLNVTVSAVSHRIHALETEIGLRLFDRNGRALTLTPAGTAYRDRLLPIIGEMQKATQAIHNATESQVVSVVSFQLFHANWLAPRIGGFMAAHPQAKVELLTLRRRKAIHPDISIRILRPGDEGTDNERLFEWRVSAICRPEVIKTYKLRTPADLARVPLIDTISAPDIWPQWLAAAGLPVNMPRHGIMVDSPSLNVDLTLLGVGVGLTSGFLAEYYMRHGIIRPFPVSYLHPGGVYINRPAGFERPIVTAFRTWLLQEVAATLEKTSTW